MQTQQRYTNSSMGLLMAGLMLLLAAACKKDGKGDGQKPDTKKQIEFFNSKADPRLLRMHGDDGATVEVIGKRTLAGGIDKVTMLSVKQVADTAESLFYLDEKGRINKVFSNDGSYLELYYDGDSSAAYTLVLKDGREMTSEAKATTNSARPGAVYGGKGIGPRGSNISVVETADEVPVTIREVGGEVSGVTILVTRCGGIPANADVVGVRVYRDVYNPGMQTGFIPATQVGEGRYVVGVPTGFGEDMIISPKELCKTGADYVQSAAEGKEHEILFDLLLKSIKQMSYGTADQSYYNAVKRIETIKEVYDFITDKFYLHKELGCDVFSEAELFNYGGISLLPVVRSQGDGTNAHEFTADPVKASAKPPYPDVPIELGSKESVQKLAMSPQHPAARQGYTITAKFSCLPLNTRVDISVKGTDGYQGSISRTVSALDNGGLYVITMSVPGAATAGIRDQIVVKAGGVTKEAMIVFGQ